MALPQGEFLLVDLTTNFSTVTSNVRGRVRERTLHGRKYFVAPMTMMVPGVLAGNKGPLYYPPEEVSRDPMAWNHMPIVLNHPEVNGLAVSARVPEILEEFG